MPPAQDKGSYRHRKFGTIEFDLVHIRGKDTPGWFKAGSADRYFLTVVETMTAYFDVEFITSKTPETVAPALELIIDRFRKQGIKVHTAVSDDGGEFKGVTKKYLEDQNIRHRIAKLAALVENRNRIFQRYFYTIVRSKRGLGLKGSMRKAAQIMNNMLNRKTGYSPGSRGRSEGGTEPAGFQRARRVYQGEAAT